MDGERYPIHEKAYEFALNVMRICTDIMRTRKEFVVSKQLIRSSTSIGANMSEANGAFSKADFRYKVSISYKESLESKYWIRLLKDTDHITAECAEDLTHRCDELSRILFAIMRRSGVKSRRPTKPSPGTFRPPRPLAPE